MPQFVMSELTLPRSKLHGSVHKLQAPYLNSSFEFGSDLCSMLPFARLLQLLFGIYSLSRPLITITG